MLDDATAGATVPVPHCTWCSAELPSNHETVCPSCGATLLGDGETQVPGLTAIDAEAILRNARAAKTKPRSRIMSWISGDYDDEKAGAEAPPGSLSPPPAAVRREILRLELEAQVANAQAEVEAMQADAALDEGAVLDLPGAENDTDEATAADDGEPPAADPDKGETPPA
ncbi:MAG TPA: hypothetical protein VFY18_13780 [Candidatus Limnocylindrales bacterium]|nr:hypothetical protein [Candidatus Limnocylindrales bacterium]